MRECSAIPQSSSFSRVLEATRYSTPNLTEKYQWPGTASDQWRREAALHARP